MNTAVRSTVRALSLLHAAATARAAVRVEQNPVSIFCQRFLEEAGAGLGVQAGNERCTTRSAPSAGQARTMGIQSAQSGWTLSSWLQLRLQIAC